MKKWKSIVITTGNYFGLYLIISSVLCLMHSFSWTVTYTAGLHNTFRSYLRFSIWNGRRRRWYVTWRIIRWYTFHHLDSPHDWDGPNTVECPHCSWWIAKIKDNFLMWWPELTDVMVQVDWHIMMAQIPSDVMVQIPCYAMVHVARLPEDILWHGDWIIGSLDKFSCISMWYQESIMSIMYSFDSINIGFSKILSLELITIERKPIKYSTVWQFQLPHL